MQAAKRKTGNSKLTASSLRISRAKCGITTSRRMSFCISVWLRVRLDNAAFVDPAVSQRKFDSEVAEWRKRASEHGRRGIVLVDAVFPKAFAVFALPRVRPAHLLFGVELDFTNYDVWPPSLMVVDPLSREPWPNGMNTPVNVILGAAMMPLFIRFRPDPAGNLTMEVPVMCQAGTGPAFL